MGEGGGGTMCIMVMVAGYSKWKTVISHLLWSTTAPLLVIHAAIVP